jgi:hypothetical protein
MPNSNTTDVIASGGALVNNGSSTLYVQCGYENPSFYTATTLSVYENSAGNTIGWVAACVQNPWYYDAAYCGGYTSFQSQSRGTYNASLYYWNSSFYTYFPYVLIHMSPQDYILGMSVQ